MPTWLIITAAIYLADIAVFAWLIRPQAFDKTGAGVTQCDRLAPVRTPFHSSEIRRVR